MTAFRQCRRLIRRNPPLMAGPDRSRRAGKPPPTSLVARSTMPCKIIFSQVRNFDYAFIRQEFREVPTHRGCRGIIRCAEVDYQNTGCGLSAMLETILTCKSAHLIYRVFECSTDPVPYHLFRENQMPRMLLSSRWILVRQKIGPICKDGPQETGLIGEGLRTDIKPRFDITGGVWSSFRSAKR